jgi:hypothetical protein
MRRTVADDIVTQMRDRCVLWRGGETRRLMLEAADQIEWLRVEVQEVWAVADALATRLETIASGNANVLREYDLRREEANRG